jgi:ketosteroid isomerase-like protein
VASLLSASPEPLRRRLLKAAFDRAAGAFNRGDLEALFALFADDVEYVPPPALRPPELLRGRVALLGFWRQVLARYPDSRIENLDLREAARGRFVRTARITHRSPTEHPLSYDIDQVTELRRGRVVRQVNAALGSAGT